MEELGVAEDVQAVVCEKGRTELPMFLGWAGLGWVGLGWAGLGGVGWAGLAGLGWAGLGWVGGLGWAGLGRAGLLAGCAAGGAAQVRIGARVEHEREATGGLAARGLESGQEAGCP